MKSFTQYISEAVTVKIGAGIYNELYAMEVDTVHDASEKGKKDLADALMNAKKSGGKYLVVLETDAWRHLKDDALPNIMDICQDAGKHPLYRAAQTLRKSL